jgi:lipopolysaccharide transport system permease protein
MSDTAITLLRLTNPLSMAADLWRHRDLIRQFTVRYFVSRHRGTYLGTWWGFLLPLLTVAVYSFVFNVIFTARWGTTPQERPAEFPIVLFCGMVVYGVFSETSARSVALIVTNTNFVKKLVFPLEILPVASLGAALLFAGLSMVLVIVANAILLRRLPGTLVFFPLTVVPLAAISLGFGWFLASLGVFVRDMENVVVVLIQQVLFFLTPIFYRIDNVPHAVQWVIMLNPLAVIVDSARRTALWGQPPDWWALTWCSVVSLTVMHLGYAWFMSTKRGFADVL